ncbi:MAG: glycoside hydrolase family 3 C-terminal domain-containing protein [Clostridia bacterium]|nr:glycoside hydrolase family 3 C-terminal domain-containing protein [Clostridia bacterium]
MDIEKILAEMTREEKAALVSGTDFTYTNPIPRLGVPSLCMADGPHGLRKQTGTGDNGVSRSEPATSFPTASCTASGWNPDNLRKMGEAIAEECRHYGVHVLLGPGLNIKRGPLCGRNFEYFSEDPLLAGVMGAAMTEGIQSRGVGATLKHFAMNNSENYRFMGNSVAGENTIRSIYLRPFEYAVRHASPSAVMCAYNRINGTYCSENRWLLTDILREEWNFSGIVMSDWGAVRDRVAGLKAGMDLEMPGDTAICRRRILDSLTDGSLAVEELDKACRGILRWIEKYRTDGDGAPVDWDAHHRLAGDIAADCAVLLKNDGVLPLAQNEKLYITGPLYEEMRYQGSGSSMISPARLTSPKDAFEFHGIRESSLDECDKVLVFCGLTDEYESEGCDREHMRMPEDQIRLIDEMCGTGKKVILVLFGGSPVELPFFDRVSGILNMYLPGQNGGSAVYDLLYGFKNPSGKLAETWPLRYEDFPACRTFGKGVCEVYSEGTEVGYRYYGKHGVPVRFPFGYGLSYTTFEHSGWTKDGDSYLQTVRNTGDRFGAEVVQLYLEGELRGFEKVYLMPGEEASVRITPDERDGTAYPDGYDVPEDSPSYPVTLESRMTDLGRSFIGRILLGAMLSVAKKQERDALKMPEGSERQNALKGALFLKRILESNSPRSLSMSAGKSLPYNFACGFVEMANGHLLKGLRCLTSKITVPKLPKEE